MSESVSTHEQALLAKIGDRSARVAVIGLGHVGFPLVLAVHAAGYHVIGFDTDPSKTDTLRRGEMYIKHLGAGLAEELMGSGRFTPTSDPEDLSGADVLIMCVPTPLGAHKDPDLTYVHESARTIASKLAPGSLVVLESTTYPGTTRGEVLPILLEHARERLTLGEDLFVAYSPEREDPGREGVSTSQIPKLVGALDDAGSRVALAFYGSCIERVHGVESAEVAEAAKLLENIFRAVNIAMVNELKIVFEKMGIDVWRVIEASSTKPFGFMPFYPGPGLGGHCIPIDPYYLTWKAKEAGYATRFIELAGEVNGAMPGYVIGKLSEALNERGTPLKGARVLVVGIAYKPNVDDIRETPAAPIIASLLDLGADVSYHDPHVPEFPGMRRHALAMRSVPLNPETLGALDAVLIITDHDAVDYDALGAHAPLIVDTRNAMARVERPSARIVKA